MAITRYAGDRFVAATADTKPTGVLPGAFLTVSGDGSRLNYIKTGYTVEAWAQIQGGGGGGNPGGSNTQVQFNDNGVFGGTTGLTFDGQRLYANNFQLSGILYDSNASVGEGGMVLANEGTTGVHWKSIESVLSGVGGSGVANYVAKWSDEDTLTSGSIFDNGSVGIGTPSYWEANNPAAKLHIYSTAGGGDQVLIENTNSAAADAPDVVLYRNSSTPANSDDLGIIRFKGKNDGTDTGFGENKVIYVDIEAEIISVVSGAEGGALNFHTQKNGTSAVRMVITGDKVGIGTTAPSADLEVKSSSNSNYAFSVQSSLDADKIFGVYQDGDGDGYITVVNKDNVQQVGLSSNGLSWLNGGNVGIGTVSPTAPLHITRPTQTAGAQVDILNLYTNALNNLDGEAWINIGSSSATNLPGRPYVRIGANKRDTGVDQATAMTFWTRENATDEITERMRIDPDGKVGIGTATPGCELHVYGEDPRIRVDGITDSHPGFELSENGTRKWITYNNYVNDNLTFKTNADIRMVIQQDGNVGIGTTGPGTLLHVYGSTK